MGLKTETRTIGPFDVSVTQLSAMRAMALLPRLGKAIAPALEKLDMTTDLTKNALPVLVGFLASVEPQEAQALVRDLNVGTTVTVDGKQRSLSSDAAIDGVFNGQVPMLLQVTLFAIEVNFGDFFGDKASAAAAPPDETPQSK